MKPQNIRYIVLSIGFTVLVFIGGYLVGKNGYHSEGKQHTGEDTQHLAVKEEIRETNQKISRLQNDLQVELRHIRDSLAALKLREKVSVAEGISKKSTSNTLSVTDTTERLLDSAAVQSVLSSLRENNGKVDISQEQRDIIRAIMKFGSAQSKADILSFISDETKDESLRQIALREVDWRGNTIGMLDMLRTAKNEGLRAAAVFSAQNSDLTDDDRDVLRQEFTNEFVSSQDDLSKFAILNYFAESDPTHFYSVLNTIGSDTLPDELKNHINFLRESYFGEKINP